MLYFGTHNWVKKLVIILIIGGGMLNFFQNQQNLSFAYEVEPNEIESFWDAAPNGLQSLWTRLIYSSGSSTLVQDVTPGDIDLPKFFSPEGITRDDLWGVFKAVFLLAFKLGSLAVLTVVNIILGLVLGKG